VRCLGPKCTEEVTPQPRRRGLAKRFCSDRCRKAFSRVVAGDFSAGISATSNAPPDASNDLPLDTLTAYRAAEAAGGVRAKAYRLWSSIEHHTRYLLDEGLDAAALYQPERELLARAAHGEPVEEDKLAPVLARAEKLDTHLSFQVLKHYPRLR
jgi:hypothetical protein